MTERCARSSRSGRGEDEVGRKSKEEPDENAPRRHVFVTELARDYLGIDPVEELARRVEEQAA